MLRNFVDWLTTTVAWLRKNQQVPLPNTYSVVKVNLGCGLAVAPSWINIDGSLNALVANMPEWLNPIAYRIAGAQLYYTQQQYCQTLQNNYFIYHNLSFGIPLPSDTVDYIYSSHFWEHLDRTTGRKLLQDSLRVLKPGGTIRIGVPDLEYAWELYKQGQKERMLHDYFFIDGATGFSQHRYLYDYAMLGELMRQVGYVNIRRTQYRQGAVPDLNILDNRAEYTLFVEAEKPIAKDDHAVTN